MNIQPIYDGGLELGESPVWDAEGEYFYWCDITGKSVFRSRADASELQRWQTPLMVGALALWQKDLLLLGLEDGFYSFDLKTGGCELLAGLQEEPGLRLNDGKIDRAGRFIAGSMQIAPKEQREHVGSLYSLDSALSVTTLERGFKIPNGPCWNLAGDVFYCHDVAPRVIFAYDYDRAAGAVSNKREFAALPDDVGGVFDGATVDAEGFLWSAVIFDGKLARFSPDGALDRLVEVPVKNVTSLNFGGPKMDIIFLTSLSEAGQKDGGAYAVTDLGIKGIPEPRFR